MTAPALAPVVARPVSAPATPAAPAGAAAPPIAAPRWRPAPWRVVLVVGTFLAAAAVLAFVPEAPAARADADLARLMRAMAVVKALLVALAAGGVWWRLARPVSVWPLGAYLALPLVAAAATAAMWRLVVPGTVAIVLHAAGLALLVVAWRDPGLLPAPRR
jgi:hypothetical protein